MPFELFMQFDGVEGLGTYDKAVVDTFHVEGRSGPIVRHP